MGLMIFSTTGSGDDYIQLVPESAILTFSAVSTECINVTVLNDTLIEGSEEFDVSIVGSAFANVLNRVATVTITDDDSEW